MGIFEHFENPEKLHRTIILLGLHSHTTYTYYYILSDKTDIIRLIYLMIYSKTRSRDLSASDALIRCPSGGPTFLLLWSRDVEAGVAGEHHLGAVQHGRVRVGHLASRHTGVSPATSFTFNEEIHPFN